MMNKRPARLILSAFFLAAVFLCPPGHLARAGETARTHEPTIGETFAGEELDYDMGFWLFDGVAKGSVRLVKEGDGYVATLSARTTGFARWLRHREDTYTARMEEAEGGHRLRTLSFEKDVLLGSRRTRILTVIDYKKRVVRTEKWKDGVPGETDEFPMPPGVVYYDDPLAAFYNFRRGAYGEIGEGRQYRIKTFPRGKDKEVEMSLSIATAGEFKRRAGDGETGYLADANLAKELFGSASGDIEITFTRELVPIRAVAKDILLFGDIRASLVNQEKIKK
ncbi:MAG: DUF3108 domain-containing protein [Deltaproteobacteria bacterium]|nr:DUF3108 domain-containing protein [Deltaproteobacteria bacterium]